MNLFLFEEATCQVEWSRKDARTHHLKNVLRALDGDQVDVGVVNGTRGKGLVRWKKSGAVTISLEWNYFDESNLLPISLLIGLTRPQTCRKIIEQASALGVNEIHFFGTEKGEPSYAKSSLWQDEWRRLLIKGAEQAFSCRIPICEKHESLETAFSNQSMMIKEKIALDIYEATNCLSHFKNTHLNAGICLAIGSERGWSNNERSLLRKKGFSLFHLGDRILRVETAMVAAVGLLAGPYWSRTEGDGL